MNINTKIISFLVFSFLLISVIFTFNSINTLKNNQENNISLFKKEFIELGRELFDKNSDIFFDGIYHASVSNIDKDKQALLSYISDTYKSDLDGIVVLDLKSFDVLHGIENKNIISLINNDSLKIFVEQYILNQKKDLDLDNFDKFELDTTNTIVPSKLHFRIYGDSGIIVILGQEFLTGKLRVEFIQRQNDALFKSQIYSLIALSVTTIILIIIFMTFVMKKIVVNPLKNLISVVKMISGGDLSKRVSIESKDEIGQLGSAFNEMTEKLQNVYNDMDRKIEEKTAQLQENIKDLDEQNKIISGVLRDIKGSKPNWP